MKIILCLSLLLLVKWANSEEVIIRPAEKSEVETLFDLISELAVYEGEDLDKLPLNKESLELYGFSEKPLFYVEFAEAEEGIIGYALYFYTFSANRGKPILYLEDLYIKPEFQNKKIGTKLLNKLILYAKNMDCCRIEWHVFPWNTPAIKFYQKMGAVVNENFFQMRLDKKSFNSVL